MDPKGLHYGCEMVEYVRKHWVTKNGVKHWAAFTVDGVGICGHWILEPGKPLKAHIDIRDRGRKIGRY